jgi:hypothetical protein
VIQDPLTVWDGPYPYDVLAPVGVTPELTHKEMQDVSFALMRGGLMGPRTHQAWDELRTLRRRLLIDLLLYDVGPAEEIAPAREPVEEEPGPADSPPKDQKGPLRGTPMLAALRDLCPPSDTARGPEPRAPAEPGRLDHMIRFDR